MLSKVQSNDPYGAYCLPKSMGDKSVNRLRAITQTSLAERIVASSQLRREDEDTSSNQKICIKQ